MTSAPHTTIANDAANIAFMLERFVADTPGVEQMLGVSSDGLLMSLAVPMDRGDADKLAATVSAMTTLSVSASRMLAKGPLTQVITEFADGYLLASVIAGRACLGVVTNADCDLGVVGYEVTMLVERIGDVLTPELVTALKSSLAA